MRKPLMLILFLVLSLPIAITAAQDTAPVFEPSDCPEPVNNIRANVSEGENVICGFVTVPENRADPDNSNTIRVAVVQFLSQSDTPQPDPIIYLAGGPGLSAIIPLPMFVYAGVVGPYNGDRDVIIFDQRGIGFSEPALECPNSEDLFYASLGEAPSDELDAELFAADTACRDNWIAQGVDLSAYNTTENASDVADIITALGYEQANLYGISYGTFLAQYVMRQHPELLRSVIMDSVLPVDVLAVEEYLPNLQRAFDRLFDECAADEACNENFPDLETLFYDAVDLFNAEPKIVSVRNPQTNDLHDVYLDGDYLVTWLFSQMFQTRAIPQLPATISRLSEGNEAVLYNALGGRVGQTIFAEAMESAVNCQDIAAGNQAEAFDENLAALEPERLREVVARFSLHEIPRSVAYCNDWIGPVTEAPEANEPVTVDIPTLVLAGEYDPISPSQWSQRVADALPTSYFYEFAGNGHVVSLFSPCPTSLITDFLIDPIADLDASCVADITGVDWEPR